MKRRAFVKHVLPVLTGPALLGSLSQASSVVPPLAMSHTSAMNVLFVNIDDMAANALGCYGNSVVSTPQLDRFAATAMRFTRCYCQAPQGRSSRASIVTGLRPDTTGIYNDIDPRDHPLPNGTQSLADILHQYRIHTVNLGGLLNEPGTSVPLHDAQESVDLGPLPEGHRSGVQRLPAAQQAAGDEAAPATHILGRLATRKEQFFLSFKFVGFLHQSYCPSHYLDLYGTGEIPLPSARPVEDADIPAVAKRLGRNHELVGGAESAAATEETTRRAIGRYYAHASYIDAQVGIILDTLEREGLSNNTIVIIFGTHGFQLGEHGLWGSSTLFEQCTRVPLLIRVPGLTTKGSVCDEIVELVDLLPTLCNLLVIPPPDGLEGVSLTPLLIDPRQPWKLAAFTVYSIDGHVGRSVRTKRWRYTEWQPRETSLREFELYDLDSDPWEQKNLVRDEDCRNQRTILANLLQRGWPTAYQRSPRDLGVPGRRPSYRAHILW